MCHRVSLDVCKKDYNDVREKPGVFLERVTISMQKNLEAFMAATKANFGQFREGCKEE